MMLEVSCACRLTQKMKNTSSLSHLVFQLSMKCEERSKQELIKSSAKLCFFSRKDPQTFSVALACRPPAKTQLITNGAE